MKTSKLNAETKGEVLRKLIGRTAEDFSAQEKTVKKILEDVKVKGDEAVFDYTEKFDGIRLNADTLYVTKEEMEEAEKKL